MFTKKVIDKINSIKILHLIQRRISASFSKLDILGLTLIVISFIYFTFFIYLPENEKYYWLFPLGWDAPLYIFNARYIEYKGYFHTITDLEPRGSNLILAGFKYLTGDYDNAWHVVSLLALLLAMIGIAALYRECFGESSWGYLAGALLPYLLTTYYMFGGLFRQLIFFSLYPYSLLLIIRFLKNGTFRKLIYIICILFIEWWIWPWGFPLCIIALLIAGLLIYKTKEFLKIISISLVGIILYIIWYFCFLYLPTRPSPPPGILPSGVTRGIPFTFNEYVSKVANGSYIILFMFISSFLIEIPNMVRSMLSLSLITKDNNLIISIKIRKPRKNNIDKYFLLLVTSIILIIVSPIFPFDEVARRLSPFLVQSFWITHSLDFIARKLRGHRTLKYFFVVFILTIVLLQLDPYNVPARTARTVWWRIWYYGDIKEFLSLLKEAYKEYSFVNMQPILIIVPTKNVPRPDVTSCLYIRSFFINTIFIKAENYNELITSISLMRTHYINPSSSLFHQYCSLTVTPELFSKYKMQILYLKPLFTPESNSSCYVKFNRDGYCLERLNP